MMITAPVGMTFVSSDAPDSPEEEWTSGGVYAIGDLVQIKGTTNKRYQSLIANNVNKDPIFDRDSWYLLGPTNPYAMFDPRYGAQTKKSGVLNVIFRCNATNAGPVDSFVLIGLNCEKFRIITRGYPSMVGVMDETFIINDALELQKKFYEGYLNPANKKVDFPIHPIPEPATESETYVILEITGDPMFDDNLAIGSFIAGKLEYFGDVLYGAKISPIDFSVKETDEFGDYSIVERPIAHRVDITLDLLDEDVDRLNFYLQELHTTPLVFEGSLRHASLLLFGFWREYDIGINQPLSSLATIQIEKLTGK